MVSKTKNPPLPSEYLAQMDAYEQAFQGIEKFCMFIGHPRSGHSLVGSLLDAHPNIIIAHELNILKCIQQGYQQTKLYHFILNNSQKNAREGRMQTGYCYDVPHEWQGRFDKLKVIGDKKGGATSREIGLNESLLETLFQTINHPIYFVHVIRNPYDNISSIFMRDKHELRSNLEGCMEFYFILCEIIDKVRNRVGEKHFFDVRHEDLLKNSEQALSRLCAFLGQDTTKNYLQDCKNILFDSPHLTRNEIPWTEKDIDLVETKMKRFGFLDGYSYGSD